MKKHPKTIALINQKGGVGKTTSAINLAAGLAKLGKKITVIDTDPQAQTTYGLGVQAHELKNTVYELLQGEVPVEAVIRERSGIQLIPSSLNLSGAETELASTPGREYLLREAISYHTFGDYIFIDCPPSLGLLTLNSLAAADEVYIPVQCEYLALQGMSKLLETVEIVCKRLNQKLKVTGVIGTRYDSRKNLNRQVVDKIREYFDGKLFDTLIRENISLAECPGFGKTIFEYKPDSTGAEDYMMLCKEIQQREAK